MKTILRIFSILLAAALVAMTFSLAVNNLLAASGFSEGGQRPAARPEGGDRDSGSAARGLVEVFGTLAKLTGIVALVLLIQKTFSLFGNRRLISIPR